MRAWFLNVSKHLISQLKLCTLSFSHTHTVHTWELNVQWAYDLENGILNIIPKYHKVGVFFLCFSWNRNIYSNGATELRIFNDIVRKNWKVLTLSSPRTIALKHFCHATNRTNHTDILENRRKNTLLLSANTNSVLVKMFYVWKPRAMWFSRIISMELNWM